MDIDETSQSITIEPIQEPISPFQTESQDEQGTEITLLQADDDDDVEASSQLPPQVETKKGEDKEEEEQENKDVKKDLNQLYRFKDSDKFKDFLVLIKDDEENAERLKELQSLDGPLTLKSLVINNIGFIIEVRDGSDPAVTETCITSSLATFGDAELTLHTNNKKC